MSKEVAKTFDTKTYKLPADCSLVLRVCHADMSSSNGFVWPSEAGSKVVAPDFDPTPICGYGLHGWLWGVGSVRSADAEWGFTEKDAKWCVLEVPTESIVHLENGTKHKFPIARLLHVGDIASCRVLIERFIPDSYRHLAGIAGTATAGIAGTATAGDRGTATADDRGTAIAGDRGTATVGIVGTATAGYAGTATAGYAGTATAGDRGTATAGIAGTATAGIAGTATAGDRGTATAGENGTATAGYAGTATAGYAGTATAGENGTATAGDRGMILVCRWDSKLQRFCFVQGEVGSDGIEANVAYKLDDNGKLVRKP